VHEPQPTDSPLADGVVSSTAHAAPDPAPAGPPPPTPSHPVLPHPLVGAGRDADRAVEILSHELRSPITTIHLGTKVLRREEPPIPESVRLAIVEAVDAEAERLYRLVEDLLAVARHDRGAAPLPVRPLLLQRWLPDVVDAEMAASTLLRVEARVPADMPPVVADDTALAHVLRNLLANAERYAPEGMPVEVEATDLGQRVVLEVADHGPGIEDTDTERVFEPFYRSPRSAEAASAAGLGLAAVRSLVGAMGGAVSAANRDGGGAVFSVELAVVEEAP
jgi:two-component system OmpR family sensor kinase